MVRITRLDYDYVIERILSFIRDSVKRAKATGVVIGLSGGIDSSVTVVLAVKALGRERVTGLILPDSETTPMEDVQDARGLAESLGISHFQLDIHDIFQVYGRMLPFY